MKFQTQSAIAIATVLALAACAKPLTPEQQAFEWCKAGIIESAKNPTTAIVTVVKGEEQVRDGVPVYTFIWQPKDGLRLQNSYGAMNDVSATCSVRRDRPEFQFVWLDGTDITKRTTGYNLLIFLEERLKKEIAAKSN